MTEPSTSLPDVETALLSAIRVCARAAERNPSSSATLECAQSAHELAQAYDLIRQNA